MAHRFRWNNNPPSHDQHGCAEITADGGDPASVEEGAFISRRRFVEVALAAAGGVTYLRTSSPRTAHAGMIHQQLPEFEGTVLRHCDGQRVPLQATDAETTTISFHPRMRNG